MNADAEHQLDEYDEQFSLLIAKCWADEAFKANQAAIRHDGNFERGRL
ncbi:hypothetical protein [Candidatus Methylospira mobilis]|nr:hypothetical protein [Candidatus Methylospira mobilis]